MEREDDRCWTPTNDRGAGENATVEVTRSGKTHFIVIGLCFIVVRRRRRLRSRERSMTCSLKYSQEDSKSILFL